MPGVRRMVGGGRRIPVEPLAVLGGLVVLEALVFGGYFSGSLVAPWDFLGMSNGESFAWWRDGSFVNPPEWMPYLLGGYPSALSLTGAWYLPVGVMAAVTPFTIHAAAALQALHVGFGALGAYVLARRAGTGRVPAAFGLVAYFFAVGFISNAQHAEIARAFAWTPWILLCTSPWWPWRRPWGIPLAAVVLWQALVTSYPGTTVMLVYGVVAWLVLTRVGRGWHWRDDLLPMLAAAAAAVLLSLVKYLPFVLLRGWTGSPRQAPNTVDLGILGTVFYPFDLAFLPNDVSMRSLFVVAPVLPLALMARRSTMVRGALGLLAVGLVLGPRHLPWSGLVEMLPGLSLSRFQMADARVVTTIGLVLLAVSGMDALFGHGPVAPRAGPRRARLLACVAVPGVALLLAIAGGFPAAAWVLPFFLVVLSGAAVLVTLTLSRPGGPLDSPVSRRALAGMLVGLAALSGLQWAYANTRVWAVDREAEEVGWWGATSDELIRSRDGEGTETRRPARTPPPTGLDQRLADAILVSQTWNGAYYAGQPAVGGYVNIYGLPTTDAYLDSLRGEDSDDAHAFWSAPGLVIETDGGLLPTPDLVESCATSGRCGADLDASPAGYVPGEWRYQVSAATDVRAAMNEAYYRGMSAEVCTDGDQSRCQPVPARLGAAGNVEVDLPRGDAVLVLRYRTPGLAAGWVAHVAGWVLLAAATALAVGGRRRERRSGAFRTVPEVSDGLASASAGIHPIG